jgi:hypothetical protein
MKKAGYVVAMVAVLSFGCGDDDEKKTPDGGTPDMPMAKEGGTPDGPAGTDSAGGDTGTVSFQSEVQPIFTASCASSTCHGGSAPKAGMSLEDGTSIANLVGVKSVQCTSLNRVEAGQQDQSYLIQKLEGQGSCFTLQKMPAGGSLSTAEIDLIRSWIQGGANP